MSLRTENEKKIERNLALEDAWTRFAEFDQNSIIFRNRFFRLRKYILSMGVTAILLAITHSIFKLHEIPWIIQINNYLRYFVILIPIVVGILQSGAAKFKGGTNYILLRGSAESLKSEIFKFRAQIGIYSPLKTQNESREVKLARNIKTIGGQLMKTEVNQAGLTQYQGKIPPIDVIAEGDDGFSDLDSEKYISWRLENQLDFYQTRIKKFDKMIRQFQWLILMLGGVGTFLAAVGLEIWIAVTIAMSGAFTTYLELRQAEATLIVYNQAATNLYGIKTWWNALPDNDKKKNAIKERLVVNTESVLQMELTGWVQEMHDALAELYEDTETSSANLLDE